MSRYRFVRIRDAEGNGKPEEEESEDNDFGDDSYQQRPHA